MLIKEENLKIFLKLITMKNINLEVTKLIIYLLGNNIKSIKENNFNGALQEIINNLLDIADRQIHINNIKLIEDITWFFTILVKEHLKFSEFYESFVNYFI